MTNPLEQAGGFEVEIVPIRGELNVGPQHPGSGHMRIYVKLNGCLLYTSDAADE